MAPCVEPNYFTCTLGEAQKWKSANPKAPSFTDVINLIDGQAKRIPRFPAVGFANFKESATRTLCPPLLTFEELSALSIIAARRLSAKAGSPSETECIGLLCTSGIDFVLTWLGLIRLGFSVLLLAPQLEAPAIEHLCQTLGVQAIYTDARQRDRCASISSHIHVLSIPSREETTPTQNSQSEPFATISSTALWFHTSGTSSGLPKPIPQTHEGIVAVLPYFPGDDKPATFSNTPLYHGGLVDCLRAWTSGAMIWFFPEGSVPITANNVVRALNIAQDAKVAPVKYFSSVPYILQMLADDEEGVEMLRSMELVGVGGAALPESIGNKLVDEGVNLLSRMGSAECGFLMSSHRDYPNDSRWGFLRPIDDPTLLHFEEQEDGLSELIVKPRWPHLAKTNRDDGSYATADLFEPHSETPNLWRYHSRTDAQITLSNGKKFDPSPMEASIVASTDILADVLIFGAGKDYPGALLLPSGHTSAEDIINSIWPYVEKMNTQTQSHARVSRSMLIIVDTCQALEKSSKGTILRRKAEERFEKDIAAAYLQSSQITLEPPETAEELHSAVVKCFRSVLGRDIDPQMDIYKQGVESIACIQIRAMIATSCFGHDDLHLPLNILYDKGSIYGLVSYLQHVRRGVDEPTGTDDEQHASMNRLARKYKTCLDDARPQFRKIGKVVVLTGATGFLGAQILRYLILNAQISTVYCLIRATTPGSAYDRLKSALHHRGLSGTLEGADGKVVCLPCDLTREDLGLSQSHLTEVISNTTLIIHSAWTVNFSLQLDSFEDQIEGTKNLISAARQAGARFVFISSTAAVSNGKSSLIPERISQQPSDASPLGYSRSKWVAEQVCAAAAARVPVAVDSRAHGHSIAVIRVGQLCGDELGVWSASEAFPLMLSTASVIGCLPDLKHESANWMPVHLAAQAVLDVALNEYSVGSNTDTGVLHVVNSHHTPTWQQMLQWVAEDGSGWPFKVVPAPQWVAALEHASQSKEKHHPSFALLGLWKNAFRPAAFAGGENPARSLDFATDQTRESSPVMRDLQPLSQAQLIKMWHWVNTTFP